MVGEPAFSRAGTEHSAEVLAVLDEAAEWLRGRGIAQWPARFEARWIEEALRRGETWLVRLDGRLAATVTLDWADPLWGDDPAPAGYLHRMAVRRHAAGLDLGHRMIDWAAQAVLGRGRRQLRLDCVSANRPLRAWYEAAGFVHRGDATVGGAPGQRLQDGAVTVVSRYELALGDASPR
ncbi:GNAT family N-acetyltransferase [Peterkaempfera sp. SMS 1(5)a]|uniref:GNAT family N-acetyltransferase n=1 Tax=Peterkaempfera podocarpi TaxID=3232308 RepID=UPI00366C77D7